MLVGYIGGGTAAAAAFTLPSGYRPTYNWEFAAPAASSTTFIDVIIGTSGTVTPHVTSGGLSVCTVFPIV